MIEKELLNNMPNISVVLPIKVEQEWQRILAECCIKTLRATTQIPFELVIVETGSKYFEELADRYLYRYNPTQVGFVEALNLGIGESSGEYIVKLTTNVLVRVGWLEALLKCFEITDCGSSTLACTDEFDFTDKVIKEGLPGCILLFKNDFKYDVNFKEFFADADFVMRSYTRGCRNYLNFSSEVELLNKDTNRDSQEIVAKELKISEDRSLFISKHKGSKLRIFDELKDNWLV